MMLRKLFSVCPEGLVPHSPTPSASSSLALEFRRVPGYALATTLTRFIRRWLVSQPSPRRSEDIYRAFVNNSPDGFFVVNHALEFVQINDSFCRMLGLSRKTALGQTLSEILAGAECDPDFFSDLLSRRPGRGELTVKTARPQRVLEIHTAALPQDLFMGVARDMTVRKEREDELCRAAEWRALLLRSLNSGLAMLDVDGRVLLCNRAFETAFGLATHQLQKLSLLKPFWQTSPQQAVASLTTAHGAPLLGADNPFYRALILRQRMNDYRVLVAPSGKALAVDAAPLLDGQNALLGAVVTLRDVSAQAQEERKKRARHLIQQQAASLNASRALARELISQIEEPGSGIALYAQMLLNNLPATGEEAILVRGILKETNHLLETIRELRALAQTRKSIARADFEFDPADSTMAFDALTAYASILTGSVIQEEEEEAKL